MKLPRIKVTDHALIRYIERVRGVDLDAVRREISNKVETGVEHEAGAVIKDCNRYVLDGNVVVTVHPNRTPSRRTGCVKDKRRERDE